MPVRAPPKENLSSTSSASTNVPANPTVIGDPISLKAENSPLIPTDEQVGVRSNGSNENGKGERKSLAELASSGKNRSLLGDPVSLKAESREGLDPVDHDNGPGGESGYRKKGSKL